MTEEPEPGGIECIMCPVCNVLMLLADAEADRCCQHPRWLRCPLPVVIVREAGARCERSAADGGW